MADPRETIFSLMRHGRTVWNQDKRIQGQKDTDLAPEGVDQAKAWSRTLAKAVWDRVLTSDLSRARETARLAVGSLGLPTVEDPRLREQDWGDWVGRTFGDLGLDDMEDVVRRGLVGWEFTPPGGESRLQVLARARAALEQAAREHPGESILVVAHQGVLKCLLYDLLGLRFLPEENDPLEKYRLHAVGVRGRDWRLVALNREL